MTGECSICVEKYNKSSQIKIKCLNCDLEVCKRCVETYLLDDEKEFELPHCMGCKHIFTDEFLRSYLSKKALEELDLKKANFMFTEQVSMISDTRYLMEYDQQMLDTVVPKINDLHTSIQTLRSEYTNTRTPELRERIREEKREKKELNDHYQNWKKYKLMTYFQIIPPAIQNRVDLIGINSEEVTGDTNGFRDQIVSKCYIQGCEGYILNNTYSCVICKTKFCRSCHQVEEEDDEHMCDSVNVESVNYINQTTKKCPKCFTSIQKTDGCDQMWCTLCKHGFEWSSGKAIKNRALHNPDYFQWVETNRQEGSKEANNDSGVNLMQQHCTGLPEHQHLIRHMRLVYDNYLNPYRINVSDIQSVSNLFSFRLKLEDLYTKRYPVYLDENSPKTHFDLTKKWLNNEISKDELIAELNKKNKKQRINKRVIDNFKTFETLTNDLFHKQLYVNDFNVSIVDELHSIIDFTNSNFSEIRKVFKCSVPYIIDYWDSYFGRQYKLRTV